MDEAEAKRRAEERRDNRAMVSIRVKETGELDDWFECAYDEAESKAKAAIANRPHLAYKITHVGT